MEHVRRLLVAAKHGHLTVIEGLLNQGIHVDSGDEEGVNALHMAAANGREVALRLLLSRGASLEARTRYGWTALMLAAYYGHLRVTVILLQHRDNVCAQNNLGATALDCAARSGHVQIVALLLEAGATVNTLTGKGIDDNDFFLVSPLMTAVQHGHEEVVNLLLEKGCEVNYKQSTTNWTALMLAALNGRTAAAQTLTAHGCYTNDTNVLGQTALEIASSRQSNEVERFLNRRTDRRPQAQGMVA